MYRTPVCTRRIRKAQLLSARTKTGTYRSWSAMLTRCTNPNSARWNSYGAKGVKVCDRWRTFNNFLADVGERPNGKTLGRFKDSGNYDPNNCKWMTPGEQDANRNRPTHCPKGHHYSKKNTYFRGKKRACRICVARATTNWRRKVAVVRERILFES
jgi:hypothetical protein